MATRGNYRPHMLAYLRDKENVLRSYEGSQEPMTPADIVRDLKVPHGMADEFVRHHGDGETITKENIYGLSMRAGIMRKAGLALDEDKLKTLPDRHQRHVRSLARYVSGGETPEDFLSSFRNLTVPSGGSHGNKGGRTNPGDFLGKYFAEAYRQGMGEEAIDPDIVPMVVEDHVRQVSEGGREGREAVRKILLSTGFAVKK